MAVEYSGSLDGAGLRVAVVVARFNSFITERLLNGAQRAFKECRVAESDVAVAWVPGAFELPLVAQRLALSRRFDAVVCLGCVIRGETAHFEHVAAAGARGILDAGIQSGIPVVFGVLTTDTVEQARSRSGAGTGNKGGEAVRTAIEMANLMRGLPLGPE